MYIWVAFQLEDEKIAELRGKVRLYCDYHKLNTVALDLPQHVSLKISFQAPSLDVVKDIKSIIGRIDPFTLQYRSIDYHTGLLWITFEESKILNQVHNSLDHLLLEKYQVPRHPFDKQFYFHSTLIYDMNPAAQQHIQDFKTRIQKDDIPQEFLIKHYVIGFSETGEPGTYKVIEEGRINEYYGD